MPVLDASVVVDWVVPTPDPDGQAARCLARLAASGEPLLGPRLLPEEVSNALITGTRRNRWSGAQADTAFLLLRKLPLRLVDQDTDLDRAWELSRRYDEHPVYDLIYVAVAERLGEQLVTADEVLRRRLAQLTFVVPPA